MKIARVIGSAISTIKSHKIEGVKLMLLKAADVKGEEIGASFVAVDLVDAGVGDLVLSCEGSAARQTILTKETPVDAVIMAVIDHLELDGEVVFKQS